MNRSSFLCAAICGSMWVQATLGQSLLAQVEGVLPPAGAAPSVASAPAGGGYLGFTPVIRADESRGIEVESVKQAAPAALAGLKGGDLITAVNGKKMTLDQFDQVLDATPPGQRVQLTIDRGGRTQQLTVTLGTKPASSAAGGTSPAESSFSSPSLSSPSPINPPSAGSFSAPSGSRDSTAAPSLTPPSNPAVADTTAPSLSPPATSELLPGAGTLSTPAPAEPSPRSIRAQPLELGPPPGSTVAPDAAADRTGTPGSSGEAGGGASLGVTVDALTEEARARAGVPVRGGAYIANVKRGSPAELAGLPIGGVIVRMGSRPVSSANDLVDAVKAARPGQEMEVMYYDRGRPYTKMVVLASAGGGEAGSGDARSGNPIAGPPSIGGPPAAGEGPLRGVPGALGNRPMLRNLGQMAADTIGRPGALSTVYDPSVVAALKGRVEELTKQTEQLEERIRALESKLGSSAITPGGASTSPSLTPPASATPASPSFGAPSGPGFGPALGSGTNP